MLGLVALVHKEVQELLAKYIAFYVELPQYILDVRRIWLSLRFAEAVTISVIVAELRNDSIGDRVGLVYDIRIDLAPSIP